ncbi:MAG: DUF4091 domain-containing protein, partial [Candidatus Omnitrophica bacterium]|nr:DUF4091 domain-containing protein [Candidatus Omnitrophota bacterium]
SLKVGDREIDSTIAVGNLVEGGNLEIVCVDLEGNLACANAHGRELWRATLPSRARRPPSIADFDGDGERDLLVTGYFSKFYLFNSEGETTEETAGFSTNGGATLIENHGRLSAAIPGADGNVQCVTWRKEGSSAPAKVEWGMYRFDAQQTGSLLDQPDASVSQTAIEKDRETAIARLEELLPGLEQGVDQLEVQRKALAEKGASLPEIGAVELDLLEVDKRARDLLENRATSEIVPLLTTARAIDRGVVTMERARGQAEAVMNRLEEKGPAPFLVWESNPWWQIRELREETDPFLKSERISLEMYRNETESAALNLMNLSEETLTIQVGVESKGEGDKAPEVTVFEVVSVPTEVEDFSDDALVELNKGNLVRLSPGETRQVFLNFAAGPERSGTFEYEIRFSPLLPLVEPAAFPAQIRVHDLDILDGTAPHLCTWGYLYSSLLKDFPEETWRDRISHGNNVLVVTSHDLPTGLYDLSGELVEPLDWSMLGEFIDSRPGLDILLFLKADFVQPAEKGFGEEARQKANKTYVKSWVDFLASKGIGYDRFAYYPVDEPGLSPGLVERFIGYAKDCRAADPRVRIYTDPVERADLEDIEAMAPYVDIWCPNRSGFLLKDDDPRMEVMKREGDRLWTYECLHHAKHRPPLHYYRGLAWLSALRGCTGFGFWSYCTHRDNPWFYPENALHDYLLVYPGDGVVTSRRWESVRDGIEDLRAVSLLKKKLAENPNPEGEKA